MRSENSAENNAPYIAGRRPRLICVGTGRDGTLSIYKMIEDIFACTDGRQTMHEYCCREFYQAFCDYEETKSEKSTDDIRRMIIECPYDCIVGNGYAAILPLFRELWGPDTRLLHIRRANREACIASLIKNCEMFPVAYRYYTSAKGATVKRMAAFHFDEMSRDEWEQLPTAAKFGWYYDKTHALIDQYKTLFTECVDVRTENLNETSTRRAIARLASGYDILPQSTHLNAHTFDVAAVAEEHRDKAIWLFGRLNWELIVKDDVHAIDYFLNKFIAWTGYQITGAPQLAGSKRPGADEIAAILARARMILEVAIRDVRTLESSITREMAEYHAPEKD